MSKGIDFGSDEEFIANYEKLKSSRKMGELYNCDKSSILNHAKKIGYDTNSNKTTKLSEKDKEEIRQSYYTKTSTELAKKYNVSRGMITKIWYDANLKGKEVKEHIVQDLVGQTFGFLTVTKRTSERNAGGSVIW